MEVSAARGSTSLTNAVSSPSIRLVGTYSDRGSPTTYRPPARRGSLVYQAGADVRRRAGQAEYSALRSLARPSFFRMFELLVSSSNPGLKRSRWTHDGVEFERERHSFTSPRHGIVIEIFSLTRSGRHGWSLMVTKEYWWAGPDAKPFKNLRWARPLGGERSDLFAWLRAQEAALERSLSLEMGNAKAGTQPVQRDDHESSSAVWFDESDDEHGEFGASHGRREQT